MQKLAVAVPVTNHSLHPIMIRQVLYAFICLACLALVGCATSFNREFNRINNQESRHDRHGITGPWQGTWRSGGNGHHGELRCLVEDCSLLASLKPNVPGLFRFRYHATYLGLFSATYQVSHIVRPTNNGYEFNGNQKLTGLGGGLYHYEGRVMNREFRATYRSASDHGVFEMKRPD